MATEKKLLYQDIINWASLTNAEAAQSGFYYWTNEAKKVLHLLESGPHGQLIAVIGQQGSGKTRMMFEIVNRLEKRALCIKWTGMEYIKKQGQKLMAKDAQIILDQQDYYSERKEAEEQLKKLLHPAYLFMEHRIVLIDLPDYNKRSISQRDKHLDQIQWIRNSICNLYREKKQRFEKNKRWQMRRYEEQKQRYEEAKQHGRMHIAEPQMLEFNEPRLHIPTLVLFIQEELWSDHFFLNKFRRFYVERFGPMKLLEVFKSMFSKSPFTDGAIFHIGILSQGIFRRFMNYIDILLSKWEETEQNAQITEVNVKDWIPTKTIIRDMDLELSRYIRTPQNRAIAVEVLDCLKENGETSNSILLQKFFDGNKPKCSRVLNALEPHYILQRSEGREKLWRLKEVSQ